MRNAVKLKSLIATSCAVLIAGTLISACSATQKPANKAQASVPTNAQIEAILSNLTLEEKAGQLNLINFEGELGEEHYEMIRQGKVGSLLKSNGAAQNLKLQKIAVEQSRAGVPILFQEDVIHGYKTIAPIPLAEAASWDLPAIQHSAAVAAREASAAGIQLTYAPMVDMSRDPRWGRIIEAAGEDPYLASLVAAARVKGFQESGEGNQNILATVKHFAGYGAALAGRDYNIQDLSERELREVHLPPFKAAVDADVAAVMIAYTAHDGVPLTANEYMVQDVLQGELGFNGLIMTDWATIYNLERAGVSANEEDATITAINNNIHMDMAAKKYVELLPKLVREGKVDEQLVDDAVRQVLMLKYKAGLLDDPYGRFDVELEKKELLSAENVEATKQMALKSMVLLKNSDNTLPIADSVKKVAVIGPFAKAQKDLMGWWPGLGDENDVVSIMAGLEQEFGDSIEFTYAQGVEIDRFNKAGADLIPEAVKNAEAADLVIMVLGEQEWMSGEGGGTASLHLPGLQEQLLAAVAETGKPIATVIVSGRPYVLTDVANHSDAVLQAWMPGTTGGNAVAEILSGKFNPQGKLPVTFPYHQGQVPIFYSYKKTSHPFMEGVTEDRYSTTYRDVQHEPLYPFGFGLSYTEYSYSDIKLNSASMALDGSIVASVDVTNTGDVAGREVVQLYIHDKVASVTQPVKLLKDFTLLELAPGETKTAEFTITADKLSFIGIDYQPTIESGDFDVFIGPDSVQLKQAEFTLN
ncbi:beta-glucosidase BglX [Neiella marina]|uniref:beta-glucosidase n=1 Tax=Neiella holothuriorum TaxID=2870530 RepID=A0ABS7EGM6_9GAMM|nr:beta-glucosidase BglX [Neiella holothuriorum]MBW8191494.1 beta-glucosidase BglX [Neiella holothuriorum]